MVRLSLATAAVAAFLPIFTCAAPFPAVPHLQARDRTVEERAPPKINHRNPYEATKVYRSTVPVERQEAIAASKRQVLHAPIGSPSPAIFPVKRSNLFPSPSPLSFRKHLNNFSERKVMINPNDRYANVPVAKRNPTPTQEHHGHGKQFYNPAHMPAHRPIHHPVRPVESPAFVSFRPLVEEESPLMAKHGAQPSAAPEASAEPNIYQQADMRRRAQEFSPMGMID